MTLEAVRPFINNLHSFFIVILVLEHEKNVMQRLRSLIGITSEILTLWNIMLEQDLNAIFSIIPANVQKCLLDWDLEMFIRDRNEVDIFLKNGKGNKILIINVQ
jgi:hypothetical protein